MVFFNSQSSFSYFPIITFPNQRNASLLLRLRQWRSPTLLPVPKLCRLPYWYTKTTLGYTARTGGVVAVLKSHVEIFWLSSRPQKTDGEQWQPGTASVMAQYKKMILAPNGQKKRKKKKKERKRGRKTGEWRGGEGEGQARGNSFANQALVLRSISSCQWVPGVNKVISFNPALQLYITPSSREYPGLSIRGRGGNSNLAAGLPHTKPTHTQTCTHTHLKTSY